MVRTINEIPRERIERRNSAINMAKYLYGSNGLSTRVKLTTIIENFVECESSRQPIEKQLIRSCFPPDTMIVNHGNK